MKFKYIVVYENNSDKFDIKHCRVKGKVTVWVQVPHSKYELRSLH